MAFTPKTWHDDPNTSTPITAAALIDMEARLAAYVDQQVSGGVGPAPPSITPSPAKSWGTYSNANRPQADWRPYYDASFFNTPLPANPTLASNSAALVSHLVTMGDATMHVIETNPSAGNEYSHPYFFNSPSDPLFTIADNKHTPQHSPIHGLQVRIPDAAQPADGSDHHMCVLDQVTNWEWDFWNVQSKPSGGGTLLIGWGGRTPINGPGGGSATYETAACQSDTGLIGGMIRFEELTAGVIEHAIFGVVHTTNGNMVYPGRDFGGGIDSAGPATGQWFQLNLSFSQIDALTGIHAWQKTILKAMSKYGWFVGDQGSHGWVEYQVEGVQTFTSMGLTNPWIAWCAAHAGDANSHISGTALNLTGGLGNTFWSSNLRVIDPSVLPPTPG